MKKKTLGRIVVFAFTLCVVSTCLMSGTLARYVSTSTVTGTVNVARWSGFTFAKGVATAEPITAEFTFDLADTKTANENVATSQIAPGDTGKFTFTVGPAEVAYTYSASISPLANTAIPVKFYSNEEMTTEWSNLDAIAVASVDAGTAVPTTVYWKWITETDGADTTVGIANSSTSFTIRLTATQTI